MHRLEIPFQLSGLGVQRHHGASKKVRPLTVAAVEIVVGAPERGVDNPAIFIDRHEVSPRIDARASLPTIALPGLIAGFTGSRHRMELPKLRSGSCIEGARITRRTQRRRVRHVGSDHHDILIDRGRRVVRHHHIDFAVLAEARYRRTGFCVQRDQPSYGGEEDAR